MSQLVLRHNVWLEFISVQKFGHRDKKNKRHGGNASGKAIMGATLDELDRSLLWASGFAKLY